MQYKTIVLGLLEQRPAMYQQLRSQRMLLPAQEIYARQLKASHETWKDQLAQARPASAPSQIASEALEIALQELEEALPSASPQQDSEILSLDQAMAFIRRHTPTA